MDSYNLARLKEFVEEWQKKGDGRSLHDFLNYLNFFEEADGDIFLQKEPVHDAVQLMTVHSAKGLEFPHVFILHLCKGDFPSGVRRPVFEFPPRLLKEEQPEGDYQKLEERRLFYVALTRGRRMLTLSTIINKRKKRSEFFDEVLGDAKIQKLDIQQLVPRVDGARARGDGGIDGRRCVASAAVRRGVRRDESVFARGAVGQGVSPAAP